MVMIPTPVLPEVARYNPQYSDLELEKLLPISEIYAQIDRNFTRIATAYAANAENNAGIMPTLAVAGATIPAGYVAAFGGPVAIPLTGLASGAVEAIASSDDLLVALAKVQAQIDAVDGGEPPLGSNIIWDPFGDLVPVNTQWDKPDATAAVARWVLVGGTHSTVVDAANPYGTGYSIRHAATDNNHYTNKRIWLNEAGLKAGDKVSAAAHVYAAAGSFYAKIQARSAAGAALTSQLSTVQALSGTDAIMRVDNFTIPATTAYLDIGVHTSGGGTTYDLWALWANAGSDSAVYPTRGEADSTFQQTIRSRPFYKSVDASNAYIYTPFDGGGWLRWSLKGLDPATYNNTGVCWMPGAMAVVKDLHDLDPVTLSSSDIDYSLGLRPSGHTNATVTGYHGRTTVIATTLKTSLNQSLALGTARPTSAGSFVLTETGTIRHPDTPSTDQANYRTVRRWSCDHPAEMRVRQSLQWLADNLVNYWNTGQLVTTSASRAWPRRLGAVLTPGGTSTDVLYAGVDTAYSWIAGGKYVLSSSVPSVEEYRIRENTLKLYPRSVVASNRINGDIDHAEWIISAFVDPDFSA